MEGLGHTLATGLQIFRPQARVFGDSRQHAWTEFFTVMECENEVRPALARKRAMRAGLAFELPAKLEQSCENTFGLRGRPLTHAAAGREMLISSGRTSPCSSCSAKTRRARTSALAIASFAEAP